MIPKATHLNAFIAGFFLTLFPSIGEIVGGQAKIVLGFFSVVWLLISAPIVVTGKNGFDWMLGKRKYWEVTKPILLRGFTYFVGGVLGMTFITVLLK